MRSMRSCRAPTMACDAAECSESTGSSVVFERATSAMKIVPARDETFLVGDRGRGPLAHGLERRLEPCGADDRRHHPIGRAARRLEQRLFTGGRLDARAGKGCLERRIALRIGDHGELCAMQDGELGKTGDVPSAGQSDDLVGRALRPIRSSVLSPIEPVAPRTEIRRGAETRAFAFSWERDVGNGSTVVSFTR